METGLIIALCSIVLAIVFLGIILIITTYYFRFKIVNIKEIIKEKVDK